MWTAILIFLYGFSFLPRAWLLLGMQISSTNLWWVADTRALSIDRISGAGNRRGGEYTCWSLFFWMSTQVVIRCFRIPLDHLLFICSDSIKSWLFPEVKSSFWGTHVLPGANVSGHFLFVYFLSLTDPFMLARTVHFYDAAFDLPNTFFLFLNTCLFRTSSSDSNIFLLYSGIGSIPLYNAKNISEVKLLLKIDKLLLIPLLTLHYLLNLTKENF